MSWLARLASPGGRKPSTAGKAKAVEDPYGAFVKAWTSLEVSCIRAMLAAPRRRELKRARALQATWTAPAEHAPATATNFARQLDQILWLLESESPAADEPLGPCLEYLLKRGLLLSLVKYASKDEPAGIRCELIKWMGRAVVQLDEGFLTHAAVNQPL